MEDKDDGVMALFQDGHKENKSRKRKLDKDGFVCPTTPDIPKTSHQFVENGHHGHFGGLDSVSRFQTFGGDFSQADSQSVSSYFKTGIDLMPLQTTDENTAYELEAENPSYETMTNNVSYKMGDNQSTDTETVNNANQEQPVREDSEGFDVGEEDNFSFQKDGLQGQTGEGSLAYDTQNLQFETEENKLTYQIQSDLPNEEGAAIQERTDNLLQSLVKGFEQESSGMFDQWSKIFRQCGEYELLCQQKLDGMLQDARSIEESLNGKKDVLCNRLKGIGQTLET